MTLLPSRSDAYQLCTLALMLTAMIILVVLGNSVAVSVAAAGGGGLAAVEVAGRLFGAKSRHKA